MPNRELLSLVGEAPSSFQDSAGKGGEAKTPSGRGGLWEGLASMGLGQSRGQDLGLESLAARPWLLPSLDPTGLASPDTPDSLLPSLQSASQIQPGFMHF